MGGKRTFDEIRVSLLKELYEQGHCTLNSLSKKAGINWKTTDNHITFLLGKGLAREIFSSDYVRIVEITDKGRNVVQEFEGIAL